MLTRRSLLSSAAQFAFAAGSTSAVAQPQASSDFDQSSRAARIRWLQANAAPIRSIDPADTDFSDLKALSAAIGRARIVMLGEQTHGDGTTFQTKARLIRSLHEEMGFDVLAFESGLFDMHKVWKRMRAGEDARTAAGRWSATREIRPLIDYVGERAHRRQPLELAGIDCMFDSVASGNRVVDDLVTFLAAHSIDTASIADWPRFCATLEKVADAYNFQQWKFSAEEQRLVLSTIDALATRIAATDGADAAFWRQLLKSTKAFAQWRFQVQEDVTRADVNLRDRAMADNLMWLAREAYPRRKIIVWAATFHILRNPHLIDTMTPDVSYAALTTMGHLAWQALGSAIYSVGFTAHEGQHGWVGQEPTPLPMPPPGSLEELWGATAQHNSFLDLRRIPAGGEWLQAPLLSRPLGYRPMLADWSTVLDAMVFTRTMRPITPAE